MAEAIVEAMEAVDTEVVDTEAEVTMTRTVTKITTLGIPAMKKRALKITTLGIPTLGTLATAATTVMKAVAVMTITILGILILGILATATMIHGMADMIPTLGGTKTTLIKGTANEVARTRKAQRDADRGADQGAGLADPDQVDPTVHSEEVKEAD
jgi:predicted lipid-binding transport protein (Tim44 family)